ncbi:MAG: 50S ribosomal protein L10 [Pseudomonadales bacterium]|nr:50S ribosomal protein L10 [Pseudomonadales bacterium]
MTLRLEDKQVIVEQINAKAAAATSVIVSDYRGITVSEVTEMRKRARAAGVSVRVVRNTLAKRAIVGTSHEGLATALVGPSLVTFSFGDPGAAARLLRDYQRECPKLEVRAISVGGDLKSGEFLDAVASLPTKDEALAKLMSVMIGPVSKLARTVKEVPAKLVRALAGVGNQRKERAAD